MPAGPVSALAVGTICVTSRSNLSLQLPPDLLLCIQLTNLTSTVVIFLVIAKAICIQSPVFWPPLQRAGYRRRHVRCPQPVLSISHPLAGQCIPHRRRPISERSPRDASQNRVAAFEAVGAVGSWHPGCLSRRRLAAALSVASVPTWYAAGTCVCCQRWEQGQVSEVSGSALLLGASISNANSAETRGGSPSTLVQSQGRATAQE